MNIHEFISSEGIQFWSVQRATQLIVLGRDCYILDINDANLAHPNTDVVILQRGTDTISYWRVYYLEQDWWGHIIHTKNEYAIWGKKTVTMGLIMGIFPTDIKMPTESEDHIIYHIRNHFYMQFQDLGHPT